MTFWLKKSCEILLKLNFSNTTILWIYEKHDYICLIKLLVKENYLKRGERKQRQKNGSYLQ